MSGKHASLQDAMVSVISRQRQKQSLQDVSAEDIFAVSVKRELKAADVDGVGRVYFYEPQSVAERDAYHKHIRFDGETARISMDGMVDGIIARVRNCDGQPLFQAHQRARLLSMSAEVLMALWDALGAEKARPLSEQTVLAAEKK